MIRFSILLCAAVLMGTVVGCNKSKLQEEVMGDSTWESSAGYEDVSVKDRKHQPDDKWEEENAPIEGAPAGGNSPESSLQAPAPRSTTGVISRRDLMPVLDGGLGRFLQHVETRPSFHKGAFVGFRIVSLFPGEPAFASLDLRPGDTVTRINGRSIERPEQAVAVWEDLRTASKLVVDYRRNGEPHALRFTIVDEG